MDFGLASVVFRPQSRLNSSKYYCTYNTILSYTVTTVSTHSTGWFSYTSIGVYRVDHPTLCLDLHSESSTKRNEHSCAWTM